MSRMTKTVTAVGAIVFQCHCRYTQPGDRNDTLMAEGSYDKQESDLKHATFIERSPFDLAANVVRKNCPDCALDFLTMIRVGTNETTMYSCMCGWRGTHDEYVRAIPAAAKKAATKQA